MIRILGRITFWKLAAIGIFFIGMFAAVQRLVMGLGAATHLSDGFPWGMWIGFDVLVGVGLAAGGFTIAATVHLFHLEKYKPIARPAVLTAFLGYILVGVGLVLDIGLPWRIWHPLVMWNPHSVMFEVAWCVMLYLTVLALEFSPVVLERFGLTVPLKLIRAIYAPLVIAGVLLSMMHQSSLGSLYLIVPDKLHGLWYTPWLPVFFFLSAVAAGLAMTIVESYLSHRAFGKRIEHHLLEGMGRVIVVILSVYALWKLQDLASRGNLGLVFRLTPEAVLFWGEMGLGVLLPALMFATDRVRRDTQLRFLAAMLTVVGFVVGRMNVTVTGMAGSSGVAYFPSWQEFAVSLSLVGAGFLIFALAVKYLDVFPTSEMRTAKPPTETPAFGIYGMPTASVLTVASLWVLLAVGVVLLAAADARAERSRTQTEPQSVLQTESVAAEVPVPADYAFVPGEDSPGEVLFSHDSHRDYAEDGCVSCHRHDFSMLSRGRAQTGPVTMERMQEGQLCGSCHDGELAFAASDNCDICHQ